MDITTKIQLKKQKGLRRRHVYHTNNSCDHMPQHTARGKVISNCRLPFWFSIFFISKIW